jgi:hypothetical protein
MILYNRVAKMSIVNAKFAKINAVFAISMMDSCIIPSSPRKNARKPCKTLFSAILLFLLIFLLFYDKIK